MLKAQTFVVDDAVSPMPWDKLSETEAKTISRVIENLKQQDFSTKHWSVHFADVFDKFFVTTRVGRIAAIDVNSPKIKIWVICHFFHASVRLPKLNKTSSISVTSFIFVKKFDFN